MALPAQVLIEEARRAGFDACAVASAGEVLRAEYFRQWLQEGKHAGMEWLARDPDRRCDPAHVLPGVQSVVLVALNYFQETPPARSLVARYALGLDYHDLMPPRLQALAAFLAARGGTQKCLVDSAPVMEKDWAARAGLGWQGKSTLAIHPRLGTWFFIGTILTTLDIEPTRPMRDHCGKCTRCIDACPTGAITAPYQLDARRCIAYLTIEHKGPIPTEFREAIGGRVFGCDDCLEACPWNRWARATQEAGLARRELPDVARTLDWDEAEFRRVFRGTPVFRLKLERWKRNACVVLGNVGGPGDLPALARAEARDGALVAEHARWASGRISARHGLGG